MSDNINREDQDSQDEAGEVFDLEALKADAIEGAKAAAYLFEHKTDDWERMVKMIRGLRGLRDLCYHKTGTRKPTDFANRQEMGRLLSQRQYAAYDRVKQYRSDAYKMMENLEDIDDWYHGRVSYQGYPITDDDRMEWKSLRTIIKHVPPQLTGHEDRVAKAPPKKTGPKKRTVTAEEDQLRAAFEALRALTLQVIKRLAKFDPSALDLLDELEKIRVPVQSHYTKLGDFFRKEEGSPDDDQDAGDETPF
jgi:hypothetical protein